jgi:S-methylmethionine-dependent homocysteine/selenocysteine methylase
VRTFAAALAAGPLLLDGGLATELEAAGHDLSDELWSARLLADAPGAIITAHRAFLDAGVDVITTASYQATVPALATRGHDGPALLRRSVELAREAIRRYGGDRPLWVAASVGPYGAALADGSEYRGDYGLSLAELVRFHRDRIRILADAGPDVLACETVPDMREAEALLTALDGVGVPAWLSYTVARGRTRAGQPLAEAFALAGSGGDGAGSGGGRVVAVGVNCASPADATAAVPVATAHSGRPAVVYPNSGETWDPTARRWTGSNQADVLDGSRWIADGARLIGGCCRVRPYHLIRLRRAIDDAHSADAPDRATAITFRDGSGSVD